LEVSAWLSRFDQIGESLDIQRWLANDLSIINTYVIANIHKGLQHLRS